MNFVQFLLVSGLLIGIQCQKTNIIKIGIIQPMLASNPAAVSTGHPNIFGSLMAVDVINSSPDILPRHRLVPILNDSRSDVATSLAAANWQARAGVAAIFSEWQSPISQAVAWELNIWKIPQIAVGSTSTYFSNKAQYPWFNRIMMPITQMASAGARIIPTLGVNRVVTIYNADAFGESSNVAFSTSAKKIGLDVVLELPVETGRAATLGDTFFKQLVRTRVTVFYASVGIADMRNIMLKARNYGLIGPGYIWIGQPSWVSDTLMMNGTSVSPLYQDTFQNVIGTYQASNTSTSYWDSWYKKYVGRVEPYAATVNSSRTPFPNYIPYAYDAIMLLAKAAHQLIEVEGKDPVMDNQRYLQIMRSMDGFQGLTGSQVKLDQSGDRIGEAYDIISYIDTNPMRIGRIYENETIELYHSYNFRDGVAPKDKPLYDQDIEVSSISGIILIVAVCVAMCLEFGLLAVFFALRNSPSLKRLSVMFCMLMISGSLLVTCIPFMYLGFPTTVSCHLERWFFNIGWGLYMTGNFVKSYRLYRIFGFPLTMKSKSIGNKDLLIGMAIGLIFPITISAVYFYDMLGPFPDPSLPRLYCAPKSGGGLNSLSNSPVFSAEAAMNVLMLIGNIVIGIKNSSVVTEAMSDTKMGLMMNYVNIVNLGLYLAGHSNLGSASTSIAFKTIGTVLMGLSVYILFGVSALDALKTSWNSHNESKGDQATSSFNGKQARSELDSILKKTLNNPGNLENTNLLHVKDVGVGRMRDPMQDWKLVGKDKPKWKKQTIAVIPGRNELWLIDSVIPLNPATNIFSRTEDETVISLESSTPVHIAVENTAIAKTVLKTLQLAQQEKQTSATVTSNTRPSVTRKPSVGMRAADNGV